MRLGGGELLGIVEECPSWGKERVTVKNAGGELLYNVVGTCCMFSCGGDVTVDVSQIFTRLYDRIQNKLPKNCLVDTALLGDCKQTK